MVISAGAPGAVPGLPGEVDAVVVEAEARHRRGVPPVEVERLPAGMHRARLEVAAVAHEVAVNLADAARPEPVGQLPQPGERVGSHAPSRRVSMA